MPSIASRGRMIQAETICKLIIVLQSGRRTIERLAQETSLSKRTIRRYLMTMSSYFNIVEEKIERQTYFWIESSASPRKGEGGRALTARFCSKGHDKFAKHGGYWVTRNGTAYLLCAICRRKSNNALYKKHRDAGMDWRTRRWPSTAV